MKKFSLEKYIAWCKENKEPIFPWAKECENKDIENWNGEYGFIDVYLIEKDWTD